MWRGFEKHTKHTFNKKAHLKILRGHNLIGTWRHAWSFYEDQRKFKDSETVLKMTDMLWQIRFHFVCQIQLIGCCLLEPCIRDRITVVMFALFQGSKGEDTHHPWQGWLTSNLSTSAHPTVCPAGYKLAARGWGPHCNVLSLALIICLKINGQCLKMGKFQFLKKIGYFS